MDQAKATRDIESLAIVRQVWPISLYETQELRAARLPRESDVDATSGNSSTHLMGHIDQLHSEGLTGNGTLIAIIDTGVDYNHPALGGGFGPNYKIAFV